MAQPPANRCLQVDVEGTDVDTVSGLLWAAGVTAIQELALDGDRVRLVAGFAPEAEPRATAALAPRWTADTFDAAHDGWLDGWRPFARPVRVGGVVVHPPWEPPDRDTPGDEMAPEVRVAIDSGGAFGQGNHASTRLALAAVTAAVTPACRLLDVGCGSGVVAVVAACLGAAPVVAIDIDDEAVRVTAANAARNGVGHIVTASATPIDQVSGSFDLVVANILAPVLVDLAPAITLRVAPGGGLVLAGLLVAQTDLVLAAYRPALTLVGTERDGDWVALRLRR